MDNWKHKSKTMICATCMYYENTRCKRHAPTIKGFPAVFTKDWCGDHKLDKVTILEIEKENELEKEHINQTRPDMTEWDNKENHGEEVRRGFEK